MAVAHPVGLAVGDLPAADGAAAPADNALAVDRRLRLGGVTGELRPAKGHQVLHPLEVLLGHNGRVAVLHEVPGLLSPVRHLPEGDGIGGEALLPEHIAGVGDVGQDVLHRVWMPSLPAMAPDSPQLIQLMGDIRRPLALEVGVVDIPDDLRLLGDDLQLPSRQPVAVGSGGRDEDPFLHPHPNADPHIVGVVGGLHLGESAVDLGDLLGGHLPGVDVLFLEADGDAQPEQFPHIPDVVRGVPGEAGGGLDQHPVDLPVTAVRDHAVELLTLPGLQPGQALVGVDVHQFPVLPGGDELGVEVHLGHVGVELVSRVAADPGVCRHPELRRLGLPGVNDGNSRTPCGSSVCLYHIFFDLLSATHNITSFLKQLFTNTNQKQPSKPSRMYLFSGKNQGGPEPPLQFGLGPLRLRFRQELSLRHTLQHPKSGEEGDIVPQFLCSHSINALLI